MSTHQPVAPYDAPRDCPKCEGEGRVDRYGEVNSYTPDGNGRLVVIGFTPREPHLVIRCGTCGWEWLTETADATSEP